MHTEENGEIAFKLHKELLANEEARRQLLIANTRILTRLKEEHLYRDILGDENAPWAGYLGLVDVCYSRSEVHDMLRIYKKFEQELHIPINSYIDIPKSRLVGLIPIINNENYEEWFSKARTLLSKDWKIELRQAKGLITEEDEHQHEYEEYEICSICGQKQHRQNH